MSDSISRIRHFFDNYTVSKGIDYFKDGKIFDFRVEKNSHSPEGSEILINSKSQSSYGTKVSYNQEIRINVDKSGILEEIVYSNCNCPVNGKCKHQVASLFHQFRNEYDNENQRIKPKKKEFNSRFRFGISFQPMKCEPRPNMKKTHPVNSPFRRQRKSLFFNQKRERTETVTDKDIQRRINELSSDKNCLNVGFVHTPPENELKKKIKKTTKEIKEYEEMEKKSKIFKAMHFDFQETSPNGTLQKRKRKREDFEVDRAIKYVGTKSLEKHEIGKKKKKKHKHKKNKGFVNPFRIKKHKGKLSISKPLKLRKKY